MNEIIKALKIMVALFLDPAKSGFGMKGEGYNLIRKIGKHFSAARFNCSKKTKMFNKTFSS